MKQKQLKMKELNLNAVIVDGYYREIKEFTDDFENCVREYLSIFNHPPMLNSWLYFRKDEDSVIIDGISYCSVRNLLFVTAKFD